MPSAFYLRPVFYSFWSGFEWFGSILKYFPFRLEGRFILRGPQCGLPSLIMWLWDAGWQLQSDPHACSPPGPCRRSHLPQRHLSRSAPTCSPRPLSVSPNSTPPGTSSKRNDARPVLWGLADSFLQDPHPVLHRQHLYLDLVTPWARLGGMRLTFLVPERQIRGPEVGCGAEPTAPPHCRPMGGARQADEGLDPDRARNVLACSRHGGPAEATRKHRPTRSLGAQVTTARAEDWAHWRWTMCSVALRGTCLSRVTVSARRASACPREQVSSSVGAFFQGFGTGVGSFSSVQKQIRQRCYRTGCPRRRHWNRPSRWRRLFPGGWGPAQAGRLSGREQQRRLQGPRAGAQPTKRASMASMASPGGLRVDLLQLRRGSTWGRRARLPSRASAGSRFPEQSTGSTTH
ncbi:uncharacterized protein LOC120592638 isoform X2 [Pteropus medius]|uniref:uncharacterized protein LOC120592638 isoform X2 n=1 Tax=Pteropus vampyrus TaxID=132908 RepID=UPI00196A3458|nr:uncharacterized protein LOC120592638 isoform X2 [Pteropus giganteus]